MRNPTFMAVIVMFFLFYTAGNVLTNHLVNYATDVGVAALTAAGMVSAMGVASTCGRVAVGAISDRIGTRADAAICCSLVAVSFLLLATQITAMMWAAVLVFGVGFGGASPLVPSIMGERLGNEKLATATGIGTMGAFLGAALGPWLGGFVFDVSGSYLWALLLAAGFSAVALIIVLWLPPAKPVAWEAKRVLPDP